MESLSKLFQLLDKLFTLLSICHHLPFEEVPKKAIGRQPPPVFDPI